jgi:predicted site-specific integrase-resolvase
MKKKLSVWAKENGLTYRNAWMWIKHGTFPCKYEITESNRIVVIENNEKTHQDDTTVVYARVSNQSRKKELDYQVDRCIKFCGAKGWTVNKSFKEIASGMNDNRKQLWAAIDTHPTRLVVENKDRLTRFGFNYLKRLLAENGTEVIVMNEATEDKEDLIKDLTSVIYSFCARLYGMRRAANKALKVKELINIE